MERSEPQPATQQVDEGLPRPPVRQLTRETAIQSTVQQGSGAEVAPQEQAESQSRQVVEAQATPEAPEPQQSTQSEVEVSEFSDDERQMHKARLAQQATSARDDGDERESTESPK